MPEVRRSDIPQYVTDENWAPPSYHNARLYFHCPDTACDGFVKLPNRDKDHCVRCEKCGLRFVICVDGPSKSQWHYVLLAILIFVIGTLAGAVAMRVLW